VHHYGRVVTPAGCAADVLHIHAIGPAIVTPIAASWTTRGCGPTMGRTTTVRSGTVCQVGCLRTGESFGMRSPCPDRHFEGDRTIYPEQFTAIRPDTERCRAGEAGNRTPVRSSGFGLQRGKNTSCRWAHCGGKAQLT